MKNFFLHYIIFLLLIISCKKEDELELPRDYGEQAIIDEKLIEDFLSSHFYNYEEFQNLNLKPEIIFDSISDENINKIPLIDQVNKKIVRVSISEELYEIPIYTLVAKEGIGESPSPVDSIYLKYEGLLLDKSKFDQSYTPIWFDLTSVVRGFREGVTALRPGNFLIDQNNLPNFENYGKGVIFLPSGLGYFSSSAGSIPTYSPLIFKIDLYLVKRTDHDGDGILSSNEYDNNGDGIPDDSDQDNIPDYLDSD